MLCSGWQALSEGQVERARRARRDQTFLVRGLCRGSGLNMTAGIVYVQPKYKAPKNLFQICGNMLVYSAGFAESR